MCVLFLAVAASPLHILLPPLHSHKRKEEDDESWKLLLPVEEQLCRLPRYGRGCSVFGGCNFHCPYCHNPHLVNLSDSEPQVSFNEYTDYIRKMRGLVDAVVLSGGEPTLCPDLSLWIDPARQYGYSVKLDTNGSNPEAVQKYLQKLSCVGLDFKLPVDRYYEFGNETSGEKWLKNARHRAQCRESQDGHSHYGPPGRSQLFGPHEYAGYASGTWRTTVDAAAVS